MSKTIFHLQRPANIDNGWRYLCRSTVTNLQKHEYSPPKKMSVPFQPCKSRAHNFCSNLSIRNSIGAESDQICSWNGKSRRIARLTVPQIEDLFVLQQRDNFKKMRMCEHAVVSDSAASSWWRSLGRWSQNGQTCSDRLWSDRTRGKALIQKRGTSRFRPI